tara:strand:+ start:13531 stop:14187 length:657 start_codon:yes stop_codon:yes gene_type:complete
MEVYTPDEFNTLYGKIPGMELMYYHVHHLASVTKQGNNVTTLFHNGYVIQFPMLFHEGTWVIHGIVQYLHTKKYYHFGKLHRQEAPAVIRIVNNMVRYQSYYWNGKFHSDGDEPAICKWDANGTLQYRVWYKHGRAHREGGPQRQKYDDTGRLILEEWRIDYALHRLDGPSKIEWKSESNSYKETWYLNGVEIPAPIVEVQDDVLEAPERWNNDQEWD